MQWTDVYIIAEELHDKYPAINPLELRFTDLHNMVLQLPNFNDQNKSNEKILEAIQSIWLEEFNSSLNKR